MNIQQHEKEKLTIEKAKTFSMNELLAFHQSRYVVKRSGISQADKDALAEQEKKLKELFPPIRVKQLSNPERNEERYGFRLVRITQGAKKARKYKRQH